MPDIAFATRTTTAQKPAANPTLRNVLKQATGAEHPRLDAWLGAFDQFSKAVTQP